jgi:hypothetical protein
MSEVRRRCVFYFSGFDPKGASHYHGLYREQAALQAQVGGLHVDVGPRCKLPSGNSGWTLNATEDGVAVETSYEFMHWDDIVRAHWHRQQWSLWWEILVTSWFNLRSGALWKVFKLSWPAAVALTLPLMLVLAALLGIPVSSLAAGVLAYSSTASAATALVACISVQLALVLVLRKLEARYSMYWMMRSYAFTRKQAQGGVPALEDRLDALAARLRDRALQARDDEILVVGHSSGAIMAAVVMARALERLAPNPVQGAARPVLSLLTLGQCIPILGLLPQAVRFRQELARLATSTRLEQWIDFSAPPDGCCFALTDPLEACEVPVPGRIIDHPKLLSPRFAQMFDAEGYKALRRDKFRMHFQYLMASALPAGYDYFRITAGSCTLSTRFQTNASVASYHDLRPFRSRNPQVSRRS